VEEKAEVTHIGGDEEEVEEKMRKRKRRSRLGRG
jgi:hypothetical protein